MTANWAQKPSLNNKNDIANFKRKNKAFFSDFKTRLCLDFIKHPSKLHNL